MSGMIGKGGATEPTLVNTDEPIRAWRQWLYFPENSDFLYSRTRWPKSEPLEAVCVVGDLLKEYRERLKKFTPATHLWSGTELSDPCKESPCDPYTTNTKPAHPMNLYCGIYGWANPKSMRQMPMWHSSHVTKTCMVVTGTVLLGGRVWPHEHGYRAQYGLVESFYDVNDSDYGLALDYGAFIREPEDSLIENWLETYKQAWLRKLSGWLP